MWSWKTLFKLPRLNLSICHFVISDGNNSRIGTFQTFHKTFKIQIMLWCRFICDFHLRLRYQRSNAVRDVGELQTDMLFNNGNPSSRSINDMTDRPAPLTIIMRREQKTSVHPPLSLTLILACSVPSMRPLPLSLHSKVPVRVGPFFISCNRRSCLLSVVR